MGTNSKKPLISRWLMRRGWQTTPFLNSMISWAQGALMGILVGLLLINFVVVTSGPFRGGSMMPTMQLGDNALIEKISWKLGLRPLQVGDIIAFNQPRKLYKRLIAMGSQRVMIRDCYVYVDGQPLKSEKFNHPEHPDPQRRCYYNAGVMWFGLELVVPEGYYFVLGDNSALQEEGGANSLDSRFEQVGFVKHENVYGRIFLRVWPPWRWGVP